jgi:TorA maturation chaperone TorD
MEESEMTAPSLAKTPAEAQNAILDTEQLARASVYALIARILTSAPDADLLGRLRAIEVDDSPGGDAMARSWAVMRLAAEHAEPEPVDDEYHRLFIGVGRGELVPYGSWYMTGFLMERPLADLRDHLAALGYERSDSVKEPEDHAGSLCEVMTHLIQDGESIEEQRAFFEQHMGPWLTRFFEDLEHAQAAVFYRAVGSLGKSFVELEQQYLSMGV